MTDENRTARHHLYHNPPDVGGGFVVLPYFLPARLGLLQRSYSVLNRFWTGARTLFYSLTFIPPFTFTTRTVAVPINVP